MSDELDAAQRVQTPGVSPVIKWTLGCLIAAFVFCGFVGFLMFKSAAFSIGIAENEVKVFHDRLSAQDYETIIANADASLLGSTSHEEFKKMLQALYKMMGPIESSTRTNWHVNSTTYGGDSISLVYQTKCKNGDMTESFVWHMESGIPKLAGYHFESPLLLKKMLENK